MIILISTFQRLINTIEVAQKSISKCVDGEITVEERVYCILDIEADLEELSALHKELENHPDAGGNAEEMKKAKIGLINVKAHLNQVDIEGFALILQNTFLFKVCLLI